MEAKTLEIAEGVLWTGSNDHNKRMFDEIMPIPKGTSYNSYIIKGKEKTALIDTVDFPFKDELIKKLKDLNIQKIDYVIANHAEQDHSGALPEILSAYPEAKVVCTDKCREILKSLLPLENASFVEATEETTLDLGERTLRFIPFPWVHWPETMLTYLVEEKILFPCDLFGCHIPFGDYKQEEIKEACKLYYAQIMMPFAAMIRRNIGKVEDLSPAVIAPSHGPVHFEPKTVMGWYSQWLSERTDNLAAIPYVSMHGSTKEAVEILAEELDKRGVQSKIFDLGAGEIDKFAGAAVDAHTIVFAGPVVVTNLHPLLSMALGLTGILKPKAKAVGLMISYGWAAGKVETKFSEELSHLKAEKLEPLIMRGHPRSWRHDIEKLADKISEKHAEEFNSK